MLLSLLLLHWFLPLQMLPELLSRRQILLLLALLSLLSLLWLLYS
jgi:hypothetical protein